MKVIAFRLFSDVLCTLKNYNSISVDDSSSLYFQNIYLPWTEAAGIVVSIYNEVQP